MPPPEEDVAEVECIAGKGLFHIIPPVEGDPVAVAWPLEEAGGAPLPEAAGGASLKGLG